MDNNKRCRKGYVWPCGAVGSCHFSFVCSSNLKHQSCFCPCCGSGVQARLSRDGSTCCTWCQLGSLMGWSIQDDLTHMSGPLVLAISWSLTSSLPGISFSPDGLSSVRNPDRCFSHGSWLIRIPTISSLHLYSPGNISLRRTTEKL